MPSTPAPPAGGRSRLPWVLLAMLVLLLALLLAFGSWLAARSDASAQANGPLPQALAAAEGVYRKATVTLRLRYSPPYLWARHNEGRWERLTPTGATTLRGTILGYELDIAQALAPQPDGQPRVSVAIAGERFELGLVMLPVVRGIATTPYLRGSMNDWGTALALATVGNEQYQTETWIAAGRHEFKVGSADWFTIDLGGNGDPEPITFGKPLPLFAVGSNIHLFLPEAGRYRFLLDLRDARRPTVTVSRAP